MTDLTSILEKVLEKRSQVDICTGLLMAQTICKRRLPEAFDNGTTDVIINIMQDVVSMIEIVDAGPLPWKDKDESKV